MGESKLAAPRYEHRQELRIESVHGFAPNFAAAMRCLHARHAPPISPFDSRRRVDKRSASTKKSGDHPVAAAPVFLGSEVRVASGKGWWMRCAYPPYDVMLAMLRQSRPADLVI
ncbi:MAG TPA: hypothetical protein PLF25_09770 [Accumulibacter sp.]|nr:hypothetical protein [Accumulibacter sp.]